MALKGLYDAIAELKQNELKRKKISSAFSNVTGMLALIGGQVERANTAWKEYEKGYKQISGKDIDTVEGEAQEGLWERTFKVPKGNVLINDRIYDKEDIRQLGEDISDPLAMTVSEDILKKWEEKVTPGEKAPERPAYPMEEYLKIASEDEFFDEEITIEETDFDDFETWDPAPPEPFLKPEHDPDPALPSVPTVIVSPEKFKEYPRDSGLIEQLYSPLWQKLYDREEVE